MRKPVPAPGHAIFPSPRASPPETSDPLPSSSIAVETHAEGESDSDGWESDDSCPSLRTVADSSDGEDDDDVSDAMKEALEADLAEFLAGFRRE